MASLSGHRRAFTGRHTARSPREFFLLTESCHSSLPIAVACSYILLKRFQACFLVWATIFSFLSSFGFLRKLIVSLSFPCHCHGTFVLYLILAQMPLETSEVLVKGFSPPFMTADAWVVRSLLSVFSRASRGGPFLFNLPNHPERGDASKGLF